MCCSLSSKASVLLPKHLAVCLPYIAPGKMNNLRNGTSPMSDSRGNIWETGWQGNRFSEASLQSLQLHTIALLVSQLVFQSIDHG